MFIHAFTCDACHAVADVTPSRDNLYVRRPEGWRSVDGRDFCTLACLAVYASEPESVPKPEYAPGIFANVGKRLTEQMQASTAAVNAAVPDRASPLHVEP